MHMHTLDGARVCGCASACVCVRAHASSCVHMRACACGGVRSGAHGGLRWLNQSKLETSCDQHLSFTASVDQLDARGLANILWAFGRLGCPPRHALLNRLLFASYLRMDELRPQELANAAWALAVMQASRRPACRRRPTASHVAASASLP
eukprot:364197-Chlamydomonas_euryale.AAC.48